MAGRLQDRLVDLLEKNILTDVTFIVHGQEFKCHKVLIASQPGVLRDHVMKNDGQPIDLGETINHGTFNNVLRYIYSDEEVKLSNLNIFEMLHAAITLSLESMEETCSKYLLERFPFTSLGDFTKLAIKFNSVKLQDICRNYFGKNTQRILESSEFLEFPEDVLNVLSRSEKINCPEVTLFNGCLNWAQYKCRQKKLESTPENLRVTLGNVIGNIRFSTMTMGDFVENVVKTQILEVAQVGQIVLDIQGITGEQPIPRYRTVLEDERLEEYTIHEVQSAKRTVLEDEHLEENLIHEVQPAKRYNFSVCSGCELDQNSGLLSANIRATFGNPKALLVTERFIRPAYSNYIEIELHSDNTYGICSVGIVPPHNEEQPGWGQNSVGYDSSGCIYFENPNLYKDVSKCQVGDRIGVGVMFMKGASSKFPPMFYFTRNGEMVYREEWPSLQDGSHQLAVGTYFLFANALIYDSDMWLPENKEQP